ncbi:hypothetical protein TUBRATIS_14590 [Tubulinosema ratisbonensis]|uniref:Uncharacterized protein n=1 Tax=Tubulinosema ratisbonensis TaxID=291195 RepID=A0A437ALG0_9MICR|nr:hypothetical protein TUBRATIS_14590 [Tubulinosema ratisbonensis]
MKCFIFIIAITCTAEIKNKEKLIKKGLDSENKNLNDDQKKFEYKQKNNAFSFYSKMSKNFEVWAKKKQKHEYILEIFISVALDYIVTQKTDVNFIMTYLLGRSFYFKGLCTRINNGTYDNEEAYKILSYCFRSLKDEKINFESEIDKQTEKKNIDNPEEAIDSFNQMLKSYIGFYSERFSDEIKGYNYKKITCKKYKKNTTQLESLDTKFRKLINTKIYKIVLKICPFISDVLKDLVYQKLYKNRQKSIHVVLISLVLKTETLIKTFFENENNLCHKQYIPVYLKNILINMKLEFAVEILIFVVFNLCSEKYIFFYMIKVFIIFCEVNQIDLKLNHKIFVDLNKQESYSNIGSMFIVKAMNNKKRSKPKNIIFYYLSYINEKYFVH